MIFFAFKSHIKVQFLLLQNSHKVFGSCFTAGMLASLQTRRGICRLSAEDGESQRRITKTLHNRSTSRLHTSNKAENSLYTMHEMIPFKRIPGSLLVGDMFLKTHK